MTQYYIYELQQYADGSFGDIRHIAYDEDPKKARQKADSKFYEVLAAAAISDLPVHAVTMILSDGTPIMHQKYVHDVQETAGEAEE